MPALTELANQIAIATGLSQRKTEALLSHIYSSQVVANAYLHDHHYTEAAAQFSYTNGIKFSLVILGAEDEIVDAYLKAKQKEKP